MLLIYRQDMVQKRVLVWYSEGTTPKQPQRKTFRSVVGIIATNHNTHSLYLVVIVVVINDQ